MDIPDTLPLEAKKIKGWGDVCITHCGADYPLLKLIKPRAYYTDYPTRIDEDGEKWTVCSTKAAIDAGNYVATKEIKEQIESDELELATYIVTAANMVPKLVKVLGELIDSIDPTEPLARTIYYDKAKELLKKT